MKQSHMTVIAVLIALVGGFLLGRVPMDKLPSAERSPAPHAEQEAPQAGTVEIAEGVYSFTPGNGYYSMFVVTLDGVAVFESVNTEHATQLLSAIRDVTDQPIEYVFQSHNHWDHSGGAQVFKDVGAEVVMHALAADWLEANPGMDTIPPDIVWEGSERKFIVGDQTVELHYLGLNHGLGMTVFVLPQLRVGYIADLVTPNRVMFTVVPDFNIGEWERTLGEIGELDFDVAVCSHNELEGEARFTCTKEHIQQQAEFISDLRNAIFAELEKGTAPFAIPGVVELPQYEDWKHYDDWLEMNAYRVLLDLWMGPFPWVPGADA